MNWDQLISTERLGTNERKVSINDKRTAFESDVDRIIFSSSFRRLSNKTQVHPFSRNDHVHTRLTHSLEVGQVGKSLGKSLGIRIKSKLPPHITENDLGTIVQAACLAHDIGNPPFGHAGEEAISHWFKSGGIREKLESINPDHANDIMMFEGNAQGFRIITQLENHLFTGGLRLTYTTLAAFLKYPWISSSADESKKFGVYLTEQKVLDKIGRMLGLVSKGSSKWSRHPLAFLSEAADDICYATIDLEDAVELGILPYEKAESLLLQILDGSERSSLRRKLLDKNSFRVNFARLRGLVFDHLISDSIDSFMQNEDRIMNGDFTGNLILSLPDDNPSKQLISEAKSIGLKNIYTEAFKSEIELGCFSTFESLLEAFCVAAIEQSNHLHNDAFISWKSKLVLRHLGNHAPRKDNAPGTEWNYYLSLRRVLDYISGMTDNYASNLASQMRGIIIVK